MISLVTGVCGRLEVTRKWLDTTVANCEKRPQVVIVSNGSTDEENREMQSWLDSNMALITRPEPMGSSAALNLGARYAEGEILVVVHNDTYVTQIGWDTVIMDFLSGRPEAGLVGPAGAKWLGRDDIYQTPYELGQLARGDVWTSLEEWEPHGRHATDPIPVAVLDGLFMACRTQDFWSWGGFDEAYIHHMQDNSLCLEAHMAGRTNYVVPIQTVHQSGQTANGERYQAKFGPDAETHRRSHEVFYEHYRGRLPVKVA